MGWVRHEIEMFGIQLREHDERYRYGAEWVTALERLWTEDEPFDFDGEFIKLKQAQSKPKPVSKPRPVLVNAGNSNAGIDFSARYCDYNFATINDMESGAELVQRVKSLAENEYKRNLRVMSYGSIVAVRPRRRPRRLSKKSLSMLTTRPAETLCGPTAQKANRSGS
jgi:FMNH2-dependent dimethyl sulfone monooxygenase